MKIHTSNQPFLSLGFGDYEINWGCHIAGLYETSEERDEIIFGYLKEGDHQGDKGLYSLTDTTAEHFNREFQNYCPECGKRLKDSYYYEFTTARELYYPTGVFSPWDMSRGLDAFYETSQKQGPRNIRATGEMIWALEAIPGREHLFAYESRLNYFIPGKPWISICLYDISRFSGAVIMDVLRTHPYLISKGIFTENPYYQDPDQWLLENAPEFLPEGR